MEIDPSILIVALPIVALASLHFLSGNFQDSKEFFARVNLSKEEKIHLLAIKLQEEMENRILEQPQAMNIEGNLASERRTRFAREQILNSWERAREQYKIDIVFQSFLLWEERGKILCFIGSILNMLMILGGIIVVVTITQKFAVAIWQAAIILFLLAGPILLVLVCFLYAHNTKRKLHELLG